MVAPLAFILTYLGLTFSKLPLDIQSKSTSVLLVYSDLQIFFLKNSKGLNLGGQCLKNKIRTSTANGTKSTSQKLLFKAYISCAKGKEQKKGYVKNNAEINWSTEI